jgi:hypothetical protein
VCVRVCVFVCVRACTPFACVSVDVRPCFHCSRVGMRGDRGADIIARAVKTGNGNLKRLNLSGQRAGHVLSRADVDGARRHRRDEGGR